MNKSLLIPGMLAAVACGLIIVTNSTSPTSPTPTALQAASGETSSDTLRQPLRSIMVGLGQDMSRVNDGIWHEDYEMIRRGATAVADHPRVTPDEQKAIQAALGDRFPVFGAHDRSVHETASRLAEAAVAKSMQDVFRYQGELVQQCVSCHTAFRDEVRRAINK